jgi:hypothetical protein
VWVSEAIFNKTPPPPPANVDPIEPIPPTGTKITIRQRIEAHAKNASCADCHAKIDPLTVGGISHAIVGTLIIMAMALIFSVGFPTGMEGLTYPIPFSDPESLVRIAQHAEALGYHIAEPLCRAGDREGRRKDRRCL